MDNVQLILQIGGILVLSYVFLFRRSKLDHIPTLGYSSPLLSYISAYKFRWHAKEILEEGYRKYPNQVWKLATFDEWYVVANGLHQVQEIAKAKEEDLSGGLSFEEFVQLDHTLGPEVTINPYHIHVVRALMTRNICAQFADMQDEFIRSFEEIVPADSKDWIGVPIYFALSDVRSRISARLAVGFPLCENENFRFLCGHSGIVIMNGCRLRLVPPFLRPLASKFLVDVEADLNPLAEHLRPLVEFRLEQQSKHGLDWPDKPNDALTWLIETGQQTGATVTPYEMAIRLYFLTFASHLIVSMLQCALYELGTRPEYMQPLREEVEEITEKHGWTKDAVSKMHKMDSFFREIHRYWDLSLLHMGRKVLKDFTFSDGTVVPAGVNLFVNSYGSHFDDARYSSARDFDGFRFVNEDTEQQPALFKPALDYQTFGYGRFACPGRFVAAYHMKYMLGYLITAYDIKAQKDEAPLGFFEKQFFPNVAAKVYFKQRA